MHHVLCLHWTLNSFFFFIPLEAYFLSALQCAAEITPKLFEMTLALPWCYMCNAYLQLRFNWQGEEKGGRLFARQQRNAYKYYPGIYIYVCMYVLFKLGKIAITIMMLSQPDLEQMVGGLLTRTGTMRLIICTSCKGGTAFQNLSHAVKPNSSIIIIIICY